MQKFNSTYLYKFKNSSNYFFRIREGIFDQTGYVKSSGYFVASLRTSDYGEARWLALFIKSKLMESHEMDISSSRFQNDNEPQFIKTAESEKHLLIKRKQPKLRDKMAFRKALRVRFKYLLETGKSMIDYELDGDFFLPKTVPKENTEKLKVYCGEFTPNEHQVGLVTSLLPTFHNDKISPVTSTIQNDKISSVTSGVQNDNSCASQFAACVSMLNQLVTELNSFKEQRNDFTLGDDIDHEATIEAHQDVKNAVNMFGKMRNGFHEHQKAEKLKKDAYFSFDYQADIFLKEKRHEIAAKTVEKYERSFYLLRNHFPLGIDLREFTKVQTQSVKDMLSTQDKHQNVGKTGGRLSAKTKNGILSNYRTFFKWVIEETDIDIHNPFSNVSFPKQKGAPKRRSFADNEARSILAYQCSHGSEARGFRNDIYWYPKVALYSGMRLNEMSALPLSHIKQVEGIWYFDLHGLEVKNEASERTVPLAQYLLDLGILDYISDLKNRGEFYLFPQIRKGIDEPGSAGWGDPISRWFNRTLLKNLGIDSESERAKRYLISFHSLRRTLISTCVNNAEQHYLIKRIVGHSIDDDITLSVYSDMDKIPLSTLKGVLDKNLKWHEI